MRILLGTMTLAALAVAPGALAAPRAPAPERAPAPSVKLTVAAVSTWSWRMRLENTGDVPLRVTADARLLSLEITPPEPPPADKPPARPVAHRPPRTVHCALPADMRPHDDVERALVVPTKRAYAETFDPRLYCFGAAESAALVPGAKVVAHLGFGAPPRGNAVPQPPLEVSPLDGVVPAVAPLKEVIAEPFVIPPEPPPAKDVPTARAAETPIDPFPAKLSLHVPAHVESWNVSDLSIPVTVQNDGTRTVRLLLRPETLGFDVIGPRGVAHCEWPTLPPAPLAEAYAALPPHGRHTVSVLLKALCPGQTLDHPGLFIVRPRLDTRRASGEPIGLRTFDGEVIGASTTVVRIHQGRQVPRRERPKLEEP